MKCKRFRQYELGKMDEETFVRHIRECAVCREEAVLDTRLEDKIHELREPVHAPRLWPRIEAGLQEEKRKESLGRPHRAPLNRKLFFNPWFATAAAIILIGVCLMLVFNRRELTPSKGHLARRVLKQIESREHDYISAIEELEKNVRPKLADMDFEMLALYRERLETIDAQIERCRRALEVNPASAHIRRYMLAALQDKKKTLIRIKGYQ
jgi:hypothetical protein